MLRAAVDRARPLPLDASRTISRILSLATSTAVIVSITIAAASSASLIDRIENRSKIDSRDTCGRGRTDRRAWLVSARALGVLEPDDGAAL